MFSFKQHVEDLKDHIIRVQENANDLAMVIADNGDLNFSRVLLANASIHDESKWHGIEWEVMHMGPEVDKSLLKKAIEQHQKTNPHHPEYWGGLCNMPRIYIAEMVCDWLARSQEFATDLRGWIKQSAPERFNFAHAPEQAKQITEFVDLLLPNKFAV